MVDSILFEIKDLTESEINLIRDALLAYRDIQAELAWGSDGQAILAEGKMKRIDDLIEDIDLQLDFC